MLQTLKNVKYFIIIVVLLASINVGIDTVESSGVTPYGGLKYGQTVNLIGDLTAAGMDADMEEAVIIKVERTIKSVIPDNYTHNLGEMMVFNVYNPEKGITSGDRGYILVPKNKAIIKQYATLFRGDPEYVWNFVNSSTNPKAEKSRYQVQTGHGTSEWINLAIILEASGGGGGQIVPLNRHSSQEWGAYNSGTLSGFNFNKAVNTSELRVTRAPLIHFFKLNTGTQMTEQSSIEYNFSNYGVYDKKATTYLYLNNNFGATAGFGLVNAKANTSEYEIRTTGSMTWNDLPAGVRQRILNNENGNNQNTLHLITTDGVGRQTRQDLHFTYQPKDVVVTVNVTATPDRVEFKNSDINVKVKVTGEVIGLTAADISHWQIQGKKEDDSFYRSEIKTGGTSNFAEFTLIIPKSKLDSVEQYIQKFLGQVTVFTKASKSYSSSIGTAETVVYKNTPPPLPPPPVPDKKPPNAYINNIRGSSSNPEKFLENDVNIIWEYGSNEELEPEDYRLEVRDAETDQRIYRFMASDTGEPQEPLNLVPGSRYKRNGFLTDLYQNLAKDLETGKTYYTWVRAYDGFNWSSSSNSEYFMIVEKPKADFMFAEDELYVGDSIEAINTSTHPSDRPMTAEWEFKELLSGKKQTFDDWDATLDNSVFGIYEVTLTITDDLGVSDTISKSISILDPKPKAVLNISGTAKENRRIILDGTSSTSPERFPIDISKTIITITSETGEQTSIRPDSEITGELYIEALIKKAGAYKVELTVENERGSSTTVKNIVIRPDSKPVASYSTTPVEYREVDKNGMKYAEIELTSGSFSPDLDLIASQRWTVVWNHTNAKTAENMPDFSSSPVMWQFTTEDIIANGGELSTTVNYTVAGNTFAVELFASYTTPVVYFYTPLVGYYLVDLEVIEEFGQPTIYEFVTADDRRRNNTSDLPANSKTIRVDNRAPTVEWKNE